MADSLFLEPMKRWFQNKLNRQPSGREADLTVGGIDSSDQLRNILAEHRAAGTSPAGVWRHHKHLQQIPVNPTPRSAPSVMSLMMPGHNFAPNVGAVFL